MPRFAYAFLHSIFNVSWLCYVSDAFYTLILNILRSVYACSYEHEYLIIRYYLLYIPLYLFFLGYFSSPLTHLYIAIRIRWKYVHRLYVSAVMILHIYIYIYTCLSRTAMQTHSCHKDGILWLHPYYVRMNQQISMYESKSLHILPSSFCILLM